MTVTVLHQRLELGLNRPVRLRINNNRSTYLSVKWSSDYTSVSLHRFFLEAPGDVMDDLVSYISKKEKKLSRSLKSYIERSTQGLDYTHRVDDTGLETKGRCYDLQLLMSQVNQQYFENKLDLKITWFGERSNRRRRRLTLGLYHDSTKLVKIHRLLDNPKVPEYVVRFVVYHEMLHHVIRPYLGVGSSARMKIHPPEFKQQERLFEDYERAKFWIKNNCFKV